MVTSASRSAATPFAAAIVTVDPHSGLVVTTHVVLPVVTVDPHSGLQREAIDPVRDYDLLVAYVQNEYDRRAIEVYRAAMMELLLSMTTTFVLRRIIRDLIIGLIIVLIADSLTRYALTGPAAI